MNWDSVSASVCPIARTLAVIGDRWTLLILREMVMGVHRFHELLAQTGMSSHLLTTRLRRMEKDGILERRVYCKRPMRCEYHATQKGRELDPLLMLIRSWGRKWEGDLPPGEPAFTLVDKASGAQVESLFDFPGGGENFSFEAVDALVGPTFAAERQARSEDFQSVQKAMNKADQKRAALRGPKGHS